MTTGAHQLHRAVLWLAVDNHRLGDAALLFCLEVNRTSWALRGHNNVRGVYLPTDDATLLTVLAVLGLLTL